MSKTDANIYVVGVGACTSVGANALSSAAAVRAGISAFCEHPWMIDSAGNPMIVARAPYLPQDISGGDRYVHLAYLAVNEALSSLPEEAGSFHAIPAILGLPPNRPGLPEGLDRQLTEALVPMLRGRLEISDFRTVQTGHSAGLMALEAGRLMLNSGTAEFCLVGGVDSYLEPETLAWLEANEQLHSAGNMNNAWGFVPGEAAGFCALATGSAVRKLRMRPMAEVVAVATARENNLIKTDTVCLGRGLTEAFEQVLRARPTSLRTIDNIICDMNGEPYRADEFGFTSIRVSEFFDDVTDFVAPADCWGDVGAASGPLFVNLVRAARQKGYANGPYALLWTSSESGERSAAILRDSPSVL
jgi:3-oxoacyl-[acyl-carrier-protein] synthase-1